MTRRSVRAAVLARDRGICAKCGLDCEELREWLAKQQPDVLHAAWRGLELQGFSRNSPLFEVDHIDARAEGGKDEPGNLQTLCRPCHRAKSKEHAGRRARQERQIGRKWAQDRRREVKR